MSHSHCEVSRSRVCAQVRELRRILAVESERLQDARRAGGFRLDLWQSRYREEAFDAAALLFAAPLGA